MVPGLCPRRTPSQCRGARLQSTASQGSACGASLSSPAWKQIKISSLQWWRRCRGGAGALGWRGGAQPLTGAACAELGAHSKSSCTWLGWVSWNLGTAMEGWLRAGFLLPLGFPHRSTRLGRRACQALGSCRCFLRGLCTRSRIRSPQLRGRCSPTGSSSRQKYKAEIAAGCDSTLPAAAFPRLRTGSPKSPGSHEMEGLSHKTSYSLQPDCSAGPRKVLPGLDPVLG